MTELQKRRKAAGMTQKELAEAVGIKLHTLQVYEIDYLDLGQAAARTVIKLARALNCKVEDLVQVE